MPQTPVRLSPIHDALEHLHPTWGEVSEMPVALRFGDAAAERTAAGKLGLCDASAFGRTTIKGPAAADLLRSNGAPVPEQLFAIAPLSAEGFVARTGSAEFFIEDGPGGTLAAQVAASAAAGNAEAYEVLRQDAALILCGEKAVDVLRETCGYEFHTPSDGHAGSNGHRRSWLGGPAASAAPAVLFTRMIGVSVMVLPRMLNGIPTFGLWCDGTYGLYVYETLLEIAREHGGAPIGLATFYPSLAQST